MRALNRLLWNIPLTLVYLSPNIFCKVVLVVAVILEPLNPVLESENRTAEPRFLHLKGNAVEPRLHIQNVQMYVLRH